MRQRTIKRNCAERDCQLSIDYVLLRLRRVKIEKRPLDSAIKRSLVTLDNEASVH